MIKRNMSLILKTNYEPSNGQNQESLVPYGDADHEPARIRVYSIHLSSPPPA